MTTTVSASETSSHLEAPAEEGQLVLAPRHLRDCLGRFTTGVTVVSYIGEDGEPRGATINAFSAISLDPALVMVSLDRRARICGALQDAQPFTVNILRSDQIDIAQQFAGRQRAGARITWLDESAAQLAPALADTVATFFCRPWRCYDGGDHVLVLGEVVAALTHPGEPLAFSGGGFISAGLPLIDSPMTVSVEGRRMPSWILPAHHIFRSSELH